MAADLGKGDATEAFAGVGKIAYKPDAGAEESMVFKYYNADEVVRGRPMRDWLRFAVCYWHTFRGTGMDPFGAPTLVRPYDDRSASLGNAKRRLRAAFEFMSKLGVPFWTFHDVDLCPEGKDLAETNSNLDELTSLALELQDSTGIKPLWATCNLFSHPRYMNGAATNPDAHVVAYAAAQVKKGLEIALKLGAENFVFWGGREGFQTLLNTRVYEELLHMANFFKMAVAYKEKIGFKGQFLIEPKPKEPSKHQYDYGLTEPCLTLLALLCADAMTVIGFLKTFDLDKHFKINVEPNHTTLAGHCYEHDVMFASAFGMLGSIDANTGSPDLGWDTDQFPMDIHHCTAVMKIVLEQGGIAPGGLNFDAKVRRESTDLNDIFIAHIGAMDSFARGLRIAARMMDDGVFERLIDERYASFKVDVGARIHTNVATFEECEEFVKKNGEPATTSGRQEHYERVFNNYL